MSSSATTATRSRYARRRQPRPMLEPLEDRRMLSISFNPLPTNFAGAGNIKVPDGKTLLIPVSANSPQPLTFTATTSNPDFSIQVLQAQEQFLQLTVQYTPLGASTTTTGTMVIELFNTLTPITATRIETLANQNYYGTPIGTTPLATPLEFFRIIDNFVMQTGDPTNLGTGSTGTQIPDEYNANLIYSGDGQAAMANSGQNTNDAQWFITQGTQSSLDFNYTIFGQLVEGFDVRDAIMQVPVVANSSGELSSPTNPVTVLNAQIVSDTTDCVLLLKDLNFSSEGTNITVTASDGTPADTVSTSYPMTTGIAGYNPPQVFKSNTPGQSVAEGSNNIPYDYQDPPFLDRSITTYSTPAGQPLQIQLHGISINATAATTTNNTQAGQIPDTLIYALGSNSSSPNTNIATVAINGTTGVVTVTPNANYRGGSTMFIEVGVTSTYDVTNGARGVRTGTQSSAALYDIATLTVHITGSVTGYVDLANTAQVSGWVYDPAVSTSAVDVQVDIDGAIYKTVPASASRADLNGPLDSANHGFTVLMPYLAAGNHTVKIYALNAAMNAATLISSTVITSGSIYFNEAYYLAEYPDVAAAVKNGQFTSGWQHFELYGQYEGRNPSPYFNTAYYLQANPDVAAAVKAGSMPSAFYHYVNYGAAEGRTASIFFDSSYYLSTYTDVAAAVHSGAIASAIQHFLQYGLLEGRNAIAFFSLATYYADNTDVVGAVNNGGMISGYEHFAEFGWDENRLFATNFNESDYDNRYSDVAAAIRAGTFTNGFQHWMEYGRFEGRNPL